MAIVPQRQLFRWKEIENLGDLQRLQPALKYLPDEPLMRLLESHRGRCLLMADYELPVAFELTKASSSEMPEGRKLVKKLKQRHAELVKQGCQALIADRGLDDTKLIASLWDDCGIKPVIPKYFGNRNMWKDGEETKLIDGQTCVPMHIGERGI
jgi:hypothetical protein